MTSQCNYGRKMATSPDESSDDLLPEYDFRSMKGAFVASMRPLIGRHLRVSFDLQTTLLHYFQTTPLLTRLSANT